MTWTPPEKIHLIPDEWHLERLGKLADGRLIYQETQVAYDGNGSKDFVVTYLFDPDGNLIDDLVSLVGVRGSYTDAAFQRATEEHAKRFGNDYEVVDIWVRPFSIERHGLQFGFVLHNLVDETQDDEEPWETDMDPWRVHAMPGDTLSFYAPWEDGEYDT